MDLGLRLDLVFGRLVVTHTLFKLLSVVIVAHSPTFWDHPIDASSVAVPTEVHRDRFVCRLSS